MQFFYSISKNSETNEKIVLNTFYFIVNENDQGHTFQERMLGGTHLYYQEAGEGRFLLFCWCRIFNNKPVKLP